MKVVSQFYVFLDCLALLYIFSFDYLDGNDVVVIYGCTTIVASNQVVKVITLSTLRVKIFVQSKNLSSPSLAFNFYLKVNWKGSVKFKPNRLVRVYQ